jgi:5'-3' exonuclease
MGVKGLYTYLRLYRRDIYTTTIPPTPTLRIGFDAMSMLYKYKSAYTDMYPSLRELKAQGHSLLFVFDGKAPVEKEAEVKGRRDARNDATQQAGALKTHLSNNTMSSREREILEFSLARLEYQGWHMTREIRQAFQATLQEIGIPYVKAIQEADDVLTDLAGAGKLDVVVSTDMDFLLTGVQRLWIPCHKTSAGFEEILTEEVLRGEGVSQAGLLDAGILCGVEPLRGRLSINPATAFGWLRYYGSIEAVLKSSAIKDAQLDILRDEATLASVRAHFEKQQWKTRIREDHLSLCESFLEAL